MSFSLPENPTLGPLPLSAARTIRTLEVGEAPSLRISRARRVVRRAGGEAAKMRTSKELEEAESSRLTVMLHGLPKDCKTSAGLRELMATYGTVTFCYVAVRCREVKMQRFRRPLSMHTYRSMGMDMRMHIAPPDRGHTHTST